jgi:hypothetical protein
LAASRGVARFGLETLLHRREGQWHMSPNSGSSAEDVRCSECNLAGCDSGNSVVFLKHARAPRRPGKNDGAQVASWGFAKFGLQILVLFWSHVSSFLREASTSSGVSFHRVDFLGLFKSPKIVRCWLRRARAATTSVPCSQHSGCGSIIEAQPSEGLPLFGHSPRSQFIFGYGFGGPTVFEAWFP